MIPAVVGCGSATREIKSGDRIEWMATRNRPSRRMSDAMDGNLRQGNSQCAT
jgi:hypothetical protein